MKIITHNNENLTREEVDKVSNKVRGVILNKKGHVLVAEFGGTYTLIGGAIEEGEDEIEALKREIKEEAGLSEESINFESSEPILKVKDFRRNYLDRESGKILNRQTNTLYYFITTNDDIDEIDKTSLTLMDYESEKGFRPFFTNISVLDHLASERLLHLQSKQKNENDSSNSYNFTIADIQKDIIKLNETQEALRAFREYRVEKEDKDR